MIALSKLDGSTMYLNEDNVERVEGGATSAIFLTNGTYLIVRDTVGDIAERIRAEKSSVLAAAVHEAVHEDVPGTAGGEQGATLAAMPSAADAAGAGR